jgi:type II secretory pathway pseudopilin PulG
MRRGTTLIEAMVALSITGMAIATFATSFPYASKNLSRARHTDLAASACQQQLEYWRDIGYASVPLPVGTSSATRSFTPPSEMVEAIGAVTFSRVTPELGASTAETGTVRVDAAITWAGTGYDSGKVSLTSLIAE